MKIIELGKTNESQKGIITKKIKKFLDTSVFFKKVNTRQVIKYGIIGGVNTVIAYGLFFILITYNFHYQLALTIVTIFVIINGYFWHRRWTFRSKSSRFIQEFFRFNSTYFVTYIVNSLLLYLFVEKFNIDPRLGQIYSMFFSIILNFLGHKYWSFYDRGKA